MQISANSFNLTLVSAPQKKDSNMKSLLHRLVFVLDLLLTFWNFIFFRLLLNIILFLFFFNLWLFWDLRNYLSFMSGVTSSGKLSFYIL